MAVHYRGEVVDFQEDSSMALLRSHAARLRMRYTSPHTLFD